jgi:hypothetical protein
MRFHSSRAGGWISCGSAQGNYTYIQRALKGVPEQFNITLIKTHLRPRLIGKSASGKYHNEIISE